jgi:hypothetical protein
MLPPKNDPRWVRVLTDRAAPPDEGLATRMLLMRVKQMLSFNPHAVDEAVSAAYDFFAKNESMCRQDLVVLFGSEKR